PIGTFASHDRCRDLCVCGRDQRGSCHFAMSPRLNCRSEQLMCCRRRDAVCEELGECCPVPWSLPLKVCGSKRSRNASSAELPRRWSDQQTHGKMTSADGVD